MDGILQRYQNCRDAMKIRQSGSHVRLEHADGRKTSVPVHSGENVRIGLLRKILRDVNISRDEFEKINFRGLIALGFHQSYHSAPVLTRNFLGSMFSLRFILGLIILGFREAKIK
ncbi:type II toxin-antitoxin system HicA family toxin [Candidatus Curtissbacteria bacterium]|nr:type II toxin-antitoxin system HicA family toxin [Candidatus Curtissbacteria bacterium]